MLLIHVKYSNAMTHFVRATYTCNPDADAVVVEFRRESGVCVGRAEVGRLVAGWGVGVGGRRRGVGV